MYLVRTLTSVNVGFVFAALVFVLDSSDRERLNEAFNELAKLLQEKELQGASLLVFANKQVRLAAHNATSYHLMEHSAINHKDCFFISEFQHRAEYLLMNTYLFMHHSYSHI